MTASPKIMVAAFALCCMMIVQDDRDAMVTPSSATSYATEDSTPDAGSAELKAIRELQESSSCQRKDRLFCFSE
jgi:hypothetical protein